MDGFDVVENMADGDVRQVDLSAEIFAVEHGTVDVEVVQYNSRCHILGDALVEIGPHLGQVVTQGNDLTATVFVDSEILAVPADVIGKFGAVANALVGWKRRYCLGRFVGRQSDDLGDLLWRFRARQFFVRIVNAEEQDPVLLTAFFAAQGEMVFEYLYGLVAHVPRNVERLKR